MGPPSTRACIRDQPVASDWYTCPMDNDTTHWPLADKIDTYLHSGWKDWGEYLADTIAPARHALATLAQAEAPSKDSKEAGKQRILAIWKWLDACGVESVEMHQEEDGALNLVWFYAGHPPDALRPNRKEPTRVLDKEQIQALGEPSSALYQQVVAAERDWLTHSPEAPVIRAICIAEEDVGGYIQPAEVDGETIQWEWDATDTIVALDPPLRSAAMERDTYESDALRDAGEADPQAKEWEGPYKVEAIIHCPSQKLIAFRQARNLQSNAPQPGAHGRARRI